MHSRSNSQSIQPLRGSSLRVMAWLPLILVVLLLSGCSKPATVPEPENAFPSASEMAGWTSLGAIQTYNTQTLFNYIDGASEYYFTYGFEKVAEEQYQDSGGLQLTLEIWRLANDADAYGLFSGHTGAAEFSLGHANGALIESGSRLYFWQNRFYVVLTAATTISDEALKDIGALVSDNLPTGGSRPAIMERLPSAQLVAGSEKFFHEELAIQDELFLGGENLLGLGLDTDAVYGLYQTGSDQMQLLLVQFPTYQRAAAGLKGLQGGGLDNLAAADINNSLLGAVFGNPTTAEATALLNKALGK